mmetsp:Transcript_523/g.1124  ORF Transcript_523/g.1124 Transcript_523/m.1124 type:complete len:500 (+) Transcript_523:179-1678(+)
MIPRTVRPALYFSRTLLRAASSSDAGTGSQHGDLIDSRPRMLGAAANKANENKSEGGTTAVQKAALALGASSATAGSALLAYSNADILFTFDNAGISLLGIGAAACAWGLGMLPGNLLSGSFKDKAATKFTFHLLNDQNRFSSEQQNLCALLGGNNQKQWPDKVAAKIEEIHRNEGGALLREIAERRELLSKRLELSEPRTRSEAIGVLTPKAFVLNYQDPEPPSRRRGLSSGEDPRSRAEKFGEEVSLLLACTSSHDVVVINLTSPGGAVSEFGLAASHLLRLKKAKVKTVVTVDKVAASGGFMMACCADEIVAAPFAFLGSIGVIAEMPNLNKALNKNDVEWMMFTAGKFKRTVTVFGEMTEEGKAKFQSDLESIHAAFKGHVNEQRGHALDIEQVATGEAWLALQCKEYGLVDRLATSWDILGELAAEGRDVILVKRKEPQNKSSLLALFDRASEAAHDLAAIFKTYSSLGKAGSADPTDRFQALSTSPTERSARL